MKATFTSADLSHALKTLSPVFGQKITSSGWRPGNFNIHATDNGLQISAESANTKITAFLPCLDISGKGAFTLNYKEVLTIAKANNKKDTISLDYEDSANTATLTGKISYTLQADVFMPSGFPSAEAVDHLSCLIDRFRLQSIVKRACTCLSQDYTVDSCLCIWNSENNNDVVQFIAQNGHQMQYSEYNDADLAVIFDDPGCPDKLVQDAPALAAWLENLPKTEKTLQLTGNKEYLFLRTENSEYVSRYRKDAYPNISGILDKRNYSAAQVTFNRQALVEALKLLEPTITKLACSAYFTFTKDGKASITTKGNATSLSLPVDHKGELFKIAFPLKSLYKLIESLDPSPDGFMTMELCADLGPMFMESGLDAVAIIMPMKIVEDVYYDDAVNA